MDEFEMKPKKSSSGFAAVALLVALALIGALWASVSQLKTESERLKADYEARITALEKQIEDQKNETNDGIIDVSPEDLEQAETQLRQEAQAVTTVVSAVRPSVVCHVAVASTNNGAW